MNSTLGTVLLVEDEHSLRRLVATFLRGSSYGVVEAADGPEGVSRFTDSGPFDLVMLDLNLPGFSGVEVCRRIREARPEQPVLICSAAIVPDAEDALIGMGVGDHLTKPYHPDVLLAHVARMLRPKSPSRLSLTPGTGALGARG
jgi:DNA-binding response OmpR family regulator